MCSHAFIDCLLFSHDFLHTIKYKDIIPGDPRPQNRNGKMFQSFLERHPHLTVVNSLPVCEGLITRSRIRGGKTEESVLDFFMICNRVLPFLTKMVIDEKKKYVLTNYQAVKRTGKAIDSDHNTQYMDLDLKIESIKPERIEMYNFKDKEGQNLFKQISSETSLFSNCFKNNKPLVEQILNWQKELSSTCSKAFKKIRIKRKNVVPLKGEMSKLINQRNIFANSSDKVEKDRKLQELNNEISYLEAEENRNKLMDNFKQISDNRENINVSKMWKLLNKLWPKNSNSLPTAKKNHRGKIVSGPLEIKLLLAKEYKDRLRCRPIRPDMKKMQKRKKRIF